MSDVEMLYLVNNGVAEWIAKLNDWGMLTRLNNQKQTTLGMNRGFFDHYKKSF